MDMIERLNDLSFDSSSESSIVSIAKDSLKSSSRIKVLSTGQKIGWSKGFLNSTTHKKIKITKDEIKSDTLQSIDSTYSSSIVKTQQLIDEVAKVEKPEIIIATSKKNIAFTGHIFERFTSEV